MQNKLSRQYFNAGRALQLVPAVIAAAALSACGGGGTAGTDMTANATPQVVALMATGLTTLNLDAAGSAIAPSVVPAFHAAPVLPPEPGNEDAVQNNTSAHRAPHKHQIPAEFAGLTTSGLTPQDLQDRHNRGAHLATGDFSTPAVSSPQTTQNGSAAPRATPSFTTIYTPAQIRSAYSLPALPALGATLTAAQAAQMGAGQTIYIVDAMHDPYIAVELAAFNSKFGLPGCTTTASTLPLPAASLTGCTFSVVYSNALGAASATAPAYDAGWASEIALDVEWAHATAPLARIVLIEAPDAGVTSLANAVKLGSAMGPGIVSMSFGAAEGSWMPAYDSAFTGANMAYVASTGDAGVGVSWPSAATNVMAVGGTTLVYTGGVRSETSWSGTGGGISAYVATPAYQNNTVPGMGSPAHRTVADVAFNADPYTGQYTAVMVQGATAVSWMGFGGTSIAAPQWAGILAVTNATRVLAAKPILGLPNAVLYGQVSTVPGTYAGAFADITLGSNGTCATCAAQVGYDETSGLGTPNVASLLSTLVTGTPSVPAPVVTPATISGQAGTALTFTVSASSSNPVTYALVGAPSGLTISALGIASWSAPVAGAYSVTVVVTDTVTNVSGQGVYTLNIASKVPVATAPVVSSATIYVKPGATASFSVAVVSVNAVTYSLSSPPTGMAISTAGLVTWPNAVTGTYAVTVTAKDKVTGLSGSGVYTVKVSTAGPVITASAITGVVGTVLTGKVTVTDTAPYTSLSVTVAGAPLGMTFSVSGSVITVTWTKPVKGTYNLTFVATDSNKLTAQLVVPVTVN